jgi:hypothetical protein
VNVFGAIATLVFVTSMLSLSRRVAVLTLICAVCYITQGQSVDVLGFNFTALRFVLLAGIIRALSRGELQSIRWNSVDSSVVIYASCLAIVSTVRVGTSAQFVYQIGYLYNILLSYFVFRALLKDLNLDGILPYLAYLIVPLAFLFLFESLTNHNLFSVFDSVSENSMIRDGHVRSQGPFRSPITAGAFGATFALLFAGLFFTGKRSRGAIFGFISSCVILATAHSSGPILGFFVGALSLALWPLRRKTRAIRWTILLSLVSLHLIMKAPVWFLLGRISEIVGGGGYHRSYLIDQFVNHFPAWWLLGTSQTGDWMATQLAFGGADLTNQFVEDGVRGGLLGLGLSIFLLVRCFQRLGSFIQLAKLEEPDRRFFWGIGSAIVGTVAILFSVTYFDQMHVIWTFLLASVASVSIASTVCKRVASPALLESFRFEESVASA